MHFEGVMEQPKVANTPEVRETVVNFLQQHYYPGAPPIAALPPGAPVPFSVPSPVGIPIHPEEIASTREAVDATPRIVETTYADSTVDPHEFELNEDDEPELRDAVEDDRE